MTRKKKEYPWTDKPASKIASAILRVQTKSSDLMNNKLNKLSAKRLKLVLLAFCVCWGGLSIYFIAFDKKRTARFEKIRTIHQPDEQNEYRIDSETIDQIHDYKKYMDSLGEPIRTTLLDSMNYLEQIYLQQK